MKWGIWFLALECLGCSQFYSEPGPFDLLANAKKQLKQVPIKPQVIPPLLVVHQDVAPHGVDPAAASLQAVSHEKASSQAAAGSSSSPNADIDCDISDKVSVGKNLRNCIEAFNQATAR